MVFLLLSITTAPSRTSSYALDGGGTVVPLLNRELRLCQTHGQVSKSCLRGLKKKPFLRFSAQGFPVLIVCNSYDADDAPFNRSQRPLPIQAIPIQSTGPYLVVKKDYGGLLGHNARIAPQGDKSDLRSDQRSD